MRCIVCDYCPSAGSEYNSGVLDTYHGRRFVWDKRKLGYVCTSCEGISLDALSELILPDEEVVFNAPNFTTSLSKK